MADVFSSGFDARYFFSTERRAAARGFVWTHLAPLRIARVAAAPTLGFAVSHFPFAITARLARGTVLRLAVESASYETAAYGPAPLVDAVATVDERGLVAVFLVHRGLDAPTTASIDVRSLGPVRLGESITLADDDPTATNTIEHQDRVTPASNRSARIEDGVLTIDLPPISWTALQLIPTT